MSEAHVIRFFLLWAESLHHSVNEHDCGNNRSCSSFQIYSFKSIHPFPANGGGPSALGGQFVHKIFFLRNNCVERCLCLANIYPTYAWDTQYSDFAYFHLPQISEFPLKQSLAQNPTFFVSLFGTHFT